MTPHFAEMSGHKKILSMICMNMPMWHKETSLPEEQFRTFPQFFYKRNPFDKIWLGNSHAILGDTDKKESIEQVNEERKDPSEYLTFEEATAFPNEQSHYDSKMSQPLLLAQKEKGILALHSIPEGQPNKIPHINFVTPKMKIDMTEVNHFIHINFCWFRSGIVFLINQPNG